MSLFVYALAVVAGVVAFWTPLRVALMILVSSVLLVPSGLAVSGFAGYASVQRVVIVAVLLNLVRRLHRREISGQVFEITPVHAAFLVFLAVSAVVGIGLAQTTVPLGTSTHLWAAYVDEFAFFIVALATVRAIGDLGLIARDLAVLVIVSALFAIGEHITKDSWARLLYRAAGQSGEAGSAELQHRGGDVRVRVASGFSLSYAWLLVALLPLFVVATVRRMRRWWFVAPGIALIVLAVYWTHTRSVAAPLVVGLVALAVLGRERRLAFIGVVGAAVMIGAYIASSAISTQFSAGLDQGSVDVRFDRIPSITSFVADHVYTGLGLGGVGDLGFSAVDSAYLLVYGDMGIIGLTMLILLYATALAVTARGMFAADPDQRLLAAACTLGVATMVAAGFAYDAITQLADQRVLYLLVAVGAVAAEQGVGAPRWLAVPTPSRVIAVLVAVGGGLLVYVAAPTHTAVTYNFSTLSPLVQTVSDPPNTGRILVNTVCNTATVGQFTRKPVVVTCRDPNEGRTPGSPVGVLGAGQGELRIEAPDEQTVLAVVQSLASVVRSEPRMRYFRVQSASNGPVTGRPAALRTAPVWLPMIVGFAMIMLPRERRRTAQPPDSTPEAPPSG